MCTPSRTWRSSSYELSMSSAIAPSVHLCAVALLWRNLGCVLARERPASDGGSGSSVVLL
eukprot:2502926-Prymnesium_polylepis.1